LFARESNRKAIELYGKLGFVIDARIRGVGGGLEDDSPTAWSGSGYANNKTARSIP
jgi:ribosomal protein S18 acetylase RimI-like enzyme